MVTYENGRKSFGATDPVQIKGDIPHRPRIVRYMQLQQQQCRQHRSHCGARQFSILTSPTGAHTTTLHYATSLAPPFTSNIIIIIIIIVFAQ